MKSNIIKVFIVLIGLGVVGVAIIGLAIGYYSLTLPKISSLADYHPPIPSKILAKDGTVLTEIGIHNRVIAKFEEIPKRIVDAFLSAEDSSFFEHTGVDYLGVLRALYANIKAGKVVQGGSTITQQVAKSLLLTSERSISRKIKDFLLAQKIEKKFSKEDILFLYLNQVYLGGGYYGVKSAFRGYFRKELSEASVAESAMIAGLLVAPGRYSPYRNPLYAKRRQAYVLKRMFETGKISESEYKLALQEKIKYFTREGSVFKAPYFTEWIRQKVVDIVGEDNFKENGFIVQTTLDWDLQNRAEIAIAQGVKEIDKRQGFKGPLQHLETDEEIEKFIIEYRKNLLEEKSEYFILDGDSKKQYEFEYNEEEYLKVKNDYFSSIEKINSNDFEWNSNDPMLDLLEVGKDYKAVVIKVHDSSRMVYVNLAGVHGMIPYEQFRWAHERVLDSEKNFWSYVVRPSQILKRGDIVYVQIEKKSESLSFRLYKDFKDPFFNRNKNRKELLEKLKTEKMPLLRLEQQSDVQAALFSIDPLNGEIISFVGGADFNNSKFIRTIQSNRQPGSAFKPFIYAAGLEKGFTPASIILDSPEALSGVDESLNWKPRNYDGEFKGPMTYRNALEQSRNVPAIKLSEKIGLSNIKKFVDRIGLNVELGEDLTSALGSFGVNLKELVSAYAIFPNGGRKVKVKFIKSIIDRFGTTYPTEVNELDEKLKTEEKGAPLLKAAENEEIEKKEILPEEPIKSNPYLDSLGGDQVYDKRLAYIMTNLLRGVVLHGTAKNAKEVSTFLGGKTGTTNSFVDAWFVGFTSNIVAGVWTGFDDNQTLGYAESGSRAALPIWKDYMSEVVRKYGESEFVIPEGVTNILIDKETGKLANDQTKTTFMETFVSGTGPVEETDEIINNQLDANGDENIKDGDKTIWYDDIYNE
ncbi:MAG: PBP1A family penicillin-binding protein [Halobacteriovoraceae bacterium]|nr:PBP1A family penicillin-binding protein [Halobacteriovoraceae bacterium]